MNEDHIKIVIINTFLLMNVLALLTMSQHCLHGKAYEQSIFTNPT